LSRAFIQVLFLTYIPEQLHTTYPIFELYNDEKMQKKYIGRVCQKTTPNVKPATVRTRLPTANRCYVSSTGTGMTLVPFGDPAVYLSIYAVTRLTR
jgi:hypothetical protein